MGKLGGSLLAARMSGDSGASSTSGQTGPVGEFSASKPTKYMIVVTGGELLSGVYADSHTYFLTRTLRPLGLECVGSISVDDKKSDLKDALRYCTDKAGLVIVTGGLGPTENDITREALSEFTQIPLREDRDVLARMSRRFGVSAERLRANLRRQTRVPTEGGYLKNSNGTAFGLVFESDEGVIVALPGPPRELEVMVNNELVPYLKERFGTRLPGCSVTLRFVGLGQSQIDQTLDDHVRLASDIMISSQFKGGRVDFTFSLADDTAQGRARLEELKEKIRKHLGEYMYADDETSLEKRVVELLKVRGGTLAFSEVGSGGSLAAALSGADEEHRVLTGAYIAPTNDKLRRLLGAEGKRGAGGGSEREQTEHLAKITAEKAESRMAIAVGEAVRGENGAAYVHAAYRLGDGRIESRRFRVRGSGASGRYRLVTELLDQLRGKLR
jgi:nicotinamide-nucleotide amidase